MWQIVPSIAIRAVIFTYCPPLPFANVRSPQMPAPFPQIIFFDPPLLGIHRGCFRSHLTKSKLSGRALLSPIRNSLLQTEKERSRSSNELGAAAQEPRLVTTVI